MSDDMRCTQCGRTIDSGKAYGYACPKGFDCGPFEPISEAPACRDCPSHPQPERNQAMTNLRFKSVLRYDEIQGHFRLFRVMWETGVVGTGAGHSNMISVAVQPTLFRWERLCAFSWLLVFCGVRIHRKRSFVGRFA